MALTAVEIEDTFICVILALHSVSYRTLANQRWDSPDCTIDSEATYSVSMFETVYTDFTRWATKGLAFWNLRGTDGQGDDALKTAFYSLVIGLGLALSIEALTAAYYLPSLLSEPVFRIPWFVFANVITICIFIGSLCLLLMFARVPIATSATVSLALYRLSGALPLLMIFSSEQRSEAMHMFFERLDWSLPYMAGAMHSLLFSEHVSLVARLRSWLFVCINIVIWIVYLVWGLANVLGEISGDSKKLWKIVIVIVGAWTITACIVYGYTGRFYWYVMQIMSRP